VVGVLKLWDLNELVPCLKSLRLWCCNFGFFSIVESNWERGLFRRITDRREPDHLCKSINLSVALSMKSRPLRVDERYHSGPNSSGVGFCSERSRMDCESRKLGICQLGEVSNYQSNKAELE
jgi:hypothetical protein